jgi:hypothetical protein
MERLITALFIYFRPFLRLPLAEFLRMRKMHTPLLGDESSLTGSDFSHHVVSVRVQDYDRNEPWYRETIQQTYRPWDGPLPVKPRSHFPFVLLEQTEGHSFDPTAAAVESAHFNRQAAISYAVIMVWFQSLPIIRQFAGNTSRNGTTRGASGAGLSLRREVHSLRRQCRRRVGSCCVSTGIP